MEQKLAVRMFVKEELSKGYKIEDFSSKDAEIIKKIRPLKKIIREKLYNGFLSGSIKLKAQYSDKQLKKYCSDILSNWLKKDRELR